MNKDSRQITNRVFICSPQKHPQIKQITQRSGATTKLGYGQYHIAVACGFAGLTGVGFGPTTLPRCGTDCIQVGLKKRCQENKNLLVCYTEFFKSEIALAGLNVRKINLRVLRNLWMDRFSSTTRAVE